MYPSAPHIILNRTFRKLQIDHFLQQMFTIVTDYCLDVRVSTPGRREFSVLHNVQTGFGVHPASYPMGTGGGLFPRDVNRPGREADHWPPSSA
jgi:hypothetical protein